MKTKKNCCYYNINTDNRHLPVSGYLLVRRVRGILSGCKGKKQKCKSKFRTKTKLKSKQNQSKTKKKKEKKKSKIKQATSKIGRKEKKISHCIVVVAKRKKKMECVFGLSLYD